jgi:AcrR family transcriptional regulator
VARATNGTRPSGTTRAERQPSRLNENGRETQARILAAAEQLFAERGIDGVSTRDITDAAGVNAASIHYHFGSRHGLIEALVARLADHLGTPRDRVLDELEANGDLTLPAVVDALVRSTADLANDPHGRHHAGLIVAVTNQRDLMPLVRNAFDPHTARYLAVLKKATPHLDDATRVLRYGVVRDIVNRVVGQPDGALQRWIAPSAPSRDRSAAARVDEALVAEVTAMAVAVFMAAPAPTR